MKCAICKYGETKQGTTTLTLQRDGTTVVFKSVPAEVCPNCGEAYIDDAITGNLLKVAEEAVRTGVEVDVREYAATKK